MNVPRLCFSYRRELLRWFTPMDFGKDFKAMHGHVTRSLDSELYLIAIDADDKNPDIVADHDGLICFAAEYEHLTPSLAAGAPGRSPSFGR